MSKLEGLPGQVLRRRDLPAPGQQVAVHDRQRLVVELIDRISAPTPLCPRRAYRAFGSHQRLLDSAVQRRILDSGRGD